MLRGQRAAEKECYPPQNILLFFDDHCVSVTFSHKTFGKVVHFAKSFSFSHDAALKVLKLPLNHLEMR